MHEWARAQTIAETITRVIVKQVQAYVHSVYARIFWKRIVLQKQHAAVLWCLAVLKCSGAIFVEVLVMLQCRSATPAGVPVVL